MAVFRGDSYWRRNKHWIAVIALVAFLHPVDDLVLHACHTLVVYCLRAPICRVPGTLPV